MERRTITTIFFDGQFWAAEVERWDENAVPSVARHVFGAEPNHAELLLWARRGFADLRFVPRTPETAPPRAAGNPKRAKRLVNREMKRRPRRT